LCYYRLLGNQACSGNKVNFSPATGARFSGGVMVPKLRQNINGLLSDDVEDYVTDELFKISFNPSAYTNVMYALPKDIDSECAKFWLKTVTRLTIRANT